MRCCFDAHTRSFAALGGVACRGIYDNMKTVADKVKKGKGRVVNARFAVMWGDENDSGLELPPGMTLGVTMTALS